MIPTVCNMPSLEDLRKLTPELLLTVVFKGDGSLSGNAALVRRELVRLVDKATSEYMLAREAVLLQIEESNRPVEEIADGRIIYMLEFIGHMENCINAMRRILSLLEFLRSDRSAPMQNKIDRGIINADTSDLIDMRDTLEHLGERITNLEFNDGKPVMLRLGQDEASIEIGTISMKFVAMERIIRVMHSEAIALLEKPHSDQSP